jgi:hypothetical protein
MKPMPKNGRAVGAACARNHQTSEIVILKIHQPMGESALTIFAAG